MNEWVSKYHMFIRDFGLMWDANRATESGKALGLKNYDIWWNDPVSAKY